MVGGPSMRSRGHCKLENLCGAYLGRHAPVRPSLRDLDLFLDAFPGLASWAAFAPSLTGRLDYCCTDSLCSRSALCSLSAQQRSFACFRQAD